jgi:hypothetical protein
MGQDKNKNSASGLAQFLLFSANPKLLGSSVPIRAIRGLLINRLSFNLELHPHCKRRDFS